MAVGKTLTVYLAADVGKLSRGLRTAGGDVRSFESRIDSMGTRMSSMLGPALIGAAAAAGMLAVKLGTEGVQAAVEDEAAAAKLAKTMENLGLSQDTTAVEANIDAMQRQFGIADDLLRPAFDRLVRSTGDAAKANDLLKLSMDISAGTGKSLDTVVQALGKAYDGNIGGLSRLGAGLDKATLKSGDMDDITAKLAGTFGGQAATAAGTYQGMLGRLSVGFDELKESFGAGFLKALGNANGSTGDLMQTMQDLEPEVRTLGDAFGKATIKLANFVGENVSAGQAVQDFIDAPDWQGLKDSIYGVGKSTDYFAASIMTSIPVIGPMVSGLYNLAGGWDAVAQSIGLANDAEAGPAGTAKPGYKPDFVGGALGKIIGGVTDLGKVIGEADKATANLTTSLDQGGVAAYVVSEKFVRLAEAARGTIEGLKAQADAVDDLRRKQDDYAKSVKSTLTGSLTLAGAWSTASDALGEQASTADIAAKAIELFKQQIADTKAFAESWRSIANEAGVGGQGVVDQLGAVFTASGSTAGIALATAIHEQGLAPTLAADLTAFDVFAGDVGVAFGSKFYDEGINDAEKVLEGMAEKIAKSQKKLNKMGRDIGEPMGVAIQAEIEDAIARATKSAAEARARAAAAAVAADNAAAAAVTPASAGASILRVIANTNARTGYAGSVLLS